MKKIIILGFSLLFQISSFSQNLDLIVTTSGDSIACRIDSITDYRIYFEMKDYNNWIHTDIFKSKVVEYKRNSINKKLFVFKSGTSYIESTKNINSPTSMFDIRKNSVYNETILIFCYERITPVRDKFGIAIKGGIMIFDPFFIIGEVATVSGGPKHFFETGIGGVIDPFSDLNYLTLRFGYRYQSPKGFLFKASPIISKDFIVPLIAIGYAF